VASVAADTAIGEQRVSVIPDATAPFSLSPDGAQIAYAVDGPGESQVAVHDLASGQRRLLKGASRGIWSPDSKSLVVTSQHPPDAGRLHVLAVDGSSDEALATFGYTTRPTILPFGGVLFWDAGGPQRADFTSGRNVFEIVDVHASRPVRELAPPIALTDETARYMQVSATLGALYTWSVRCSGIARDSCWAELHEIPLAGGAERIIALTRSAGPFALSRDGRRLAIASDGAVFIKELAAR
jgi:hypothetical protein